MNDLGVVLPAPLLGVLLAILPFSLFLDEGVPPFFVLRFPLWSLDRDVDRDDVDRVGVRARGAGLSTWRYLRGACFLSGDCDEAPLLLLLLGEDEGGVDVPSRDLRKADWGWIPDASNCEERGSCFAAVAVVVDPGAVVVVVVVVVVEGPEEGPDENKDEDEEDAGLQRLDGARFEGCEDEGCCIFLGVGGRE